MKFSADAEMKNGTLREKDLQPASPVRRWSPRSIAILLFAWAILQVGGLFTPGLLDDVDSIYIQIAREMLVRHDFVTPYINGVRFFDKPPLMYWMAAASMKIFGIHDWAARIPLALAVLALLFSVYALGIRLFAGLSPKAHPDRAGFYAALALATSIGPYLYTRFYIPDILLALWMTLAVYFFLLAMDAIDEGRSALTASLGFAAVLGLNVLTKGLIGIIFPLGFVVIYLAITRRLGSIAKLHPVTGTAMFLLVAAPWHVLAATRTPVIAMPAGFGLPRTGGWAWFYLYNEHFARFLGKRIPHDYGQTPVWLFWLYLAIWAMPWMAFVPGAVVSAVRTLRGRLVFSNGGDEPTMSREAALTLLLWPLLVLVFFSISNRQEYYSLPAIPALALLAGCLLASADRTPGWSRARRNALDWHLYFLAPIATAVGSVCGWIALTAPKPAPHAELSSLLAANPDAYNVSLGHLSDLTHAAMGFFRGPLTGVSLGMFVVGWGSYILRRKGRAYAANLALGGAMIVVLLSAHAGLVRFYPILGSKQLAEAILAEQQARPAAAGQPDMILLDGELTTGSAVIFYTGQQIHLINGRVNGLWYGSLWPDAPAVFETEDTLRTLWQSRRRIFLLTCSPAARMRELSAIGPVHEIARTGGKSILSNR